MFVLEGNWDPVMQSQKCHLTEQKFRAKSQFNVNVYVGVYFTEVEASVKPQELQTMLFFEGQLK